MNLKDRIKAGVAALDERARPWARQSRWNGYAYEFLLFGLKQAWACLFGGLMLVLLVGTHLFWPAGAPLARRWRATTSWSSPPSPSRSCFWP